MLAWVLMAGAAICLAYFITIVFYSGIGTSFAVIWLLLAGGLGGGAAALKVYERNPERIPLWIPVSLVTLCASGVMIIVVLQILMFGKIPVVAESGLDYVVVLGAQVKADGPSKTLRLRLDKAAEYAEQNPETILILSGGQGEGEPMTEAAAMEQYLIKKGIKKEQLLLEERSASTLENLVYSYELMEKKPAKVGVLTSNFHVYRAKKIAEKQGISDIRSIAAESDRLLFFHFCFRDALAILKDRIAGNL